LIPFLGAEENIWTEERSSDGRAKKTAQRVALYLYSSPSTIRMINSRMKRAGNVARMGERSDAYRLLVGKREGKRPLGRPRHRLVDNIKMDLAQTGWGGVDWIGLAQDTDM
jgi:hypothetical protein